MAGADVADVFISYSKKDYDEARMLAAFLEAEGYSVWWDTSLLSGESFRKVIMTELGRARAAIVIWTENSVESDWVQSEAGRAHADRKLIPVKSKVLAYKDIPPPFDNMHTGSLHERDKIVDALVAQLAKPEPRDGAVGRAFKRARFEALSWFGIVGAALTLTVNLQGVMTLATWARRLFDSWTQVLTAIWRHVFYFLPKIGTPDALILTIMSFAAINLLLCSRRAGAVAPHVKSSRWTVLSIATAVLIVLGVFALGFKRALTDIGIYLSMDCPDELCKVPSYFNSFMLRVSELILDSDGFDFTQSAFQAALRLYAAFALFAFVIPIATVWLIYLVPKSVLGLRLIPSALSSRLWRIVIAIAIVVAGNYILLWVERQNWIASLSS